jgi:Tfp pilus assembly protein PilX
MLVVVTLLSMAAMQTMRLQERMAGNLLTKAQIYEDALGALRYAESCFLQRNPCEAGLAADINTAGAGFYRVLENDPTSLPGDLNDPATWAEGHTQQPVITGQLVTGIQPWRLVVRLPDALANASLSVQNKRTLQVFQIHALTADEETAAGDLGEATSISILQSVIGRE